MKQAKATKTTKPRTRTETRKTTAQYRTATIERAHVDEEARTVELSFSSEDAYRRYFGDEILDHGPGSVRLGRLQTTGPLLMDHNTRDQVGRVQDVEISEDRKGRAVAHFSKSERASEIFQDVLDEIRTSVSVGYAVHKMVLEESGDDGVDKYRVTDWEPMEVSIVSVPADTTVGLGRSEALVREGAEVFDTEVIIPIKEIEMPEVKEENAPAPVDVKVIESKGQEVERKRVTELLNIGNNYNAGELAQKFVEEGRSSSELTAAILARDKETKNAKPDSDKPKPIEIGLDQKEVSSFSFVRLINALASNDDKLREAAAFELEVTRATADIMSKSNAREVRSEFTLPHDILRAPIARNMEQASAAIRALTVADATAAGDLVATDLLSASFIDILRNRSVMMSVATVMSDLQGNAAIPRQTAASVAGWLTPEAAAAGESDPAVDQLVLAPKEVGAWTSYSRMLLIQSSIDIEAWVRMDLAAGIGLAVDSAAINGDGSGGAPTGILNTTGIGDVPAGAAPDWDNIVDLETAVATANADIGSLMYLINASTRGVFKKTFIDVGSGERIWDSRAGNTPVNGYRTEVTNQIANDGGVGTNESAIIFGNMADVIIGLWSGVDLLVDPYTGAKTRTTNVTAYQDADVGLRHPESFAATQDAITGP